jgi:serine/threonine protein kinase
MNLKYEFIEQIGSGCFGAIYRGRNIRTGEHVAIKVESVSSETRLLKNESNVYQYLRDCLGIPKVKWFGKDDNNYYMVIELLGRTLEQIKQEHHGSFAFNLTSQIGKQVLDILQSIHNMGLVHRDIKPDNFLVGLNHNSKQLYMIDFGFCKKYSVNDTPAITNSLVGSPNYASIHAHNCIELSCRDDLESLGYMLMYLYYGKLPWADCVEHCDILKYKVQLDCCMFGKYMQYVRALKFNETPDYSFMYRLILEKI